MIEKKKSSISLEKNRMAFFSAGLILVSSLTLAAFEWKTLSISEKYSKNYAEEEVHMIEEEIITELPEPLKPKQLTPPKPQIPEVSDNIIIDNKVKNPDDAVVTDKIVDTKIEDIDFGELGFGGPTTEPLQPEIRIAEVMPEFPGGYIAMSKFISSNVEYPAEAREFNEQGTAFIEFTVEKDGSITKVKTLSNQLQFGLNEEAIRVVKSMPKWKPGEQRGRKVRVRFTIPIKFKLRAN